MKCSLLQRVTKIKEHYGLNELQLANRLGMPQSTLNYYFKQNRMPSIDTILVLLNEFSDISAEWLLRGTGSMLVSDNLPPITGTETDDTMTLHAELTRASLKVEELTTQNAKLLHQLEYMEALNIKLAGLVHQYEQQLAAAGIASSEKLS